MKEEVEIVHIILGDDNKKIGNSIFSVNSRFPELIFCFNNIKPSEAGLVFDLSVMTKTNQNPSQETLKEVETYIDTTFEATMEKILHS